MNTTMKILVCDDDADDREILESVLMDAMGNVEFIEAADGVECLRLLKDGLKPDLAFIDLNMPLKNGIECLRDIQNEHLVADTPFVVYSTSQNLKDINAASNYGARFYVVKPVSLSTLQQILQHLFTMLQNPATEQYDKNNFVISQQKLVA
jgi:CheY-like chemotaxis protein